jgi:hypothetical protein
MSNTDTVFVIPDINAVKYKMSNIYFKEHAYRKTSINNNSETEYTSTQIIYINNEIIMTGLTFLINVNKKNSQHLNDYAISIEMELLKLYHETYKVNKRARYSINDDILKMTTEIDSCKKIGLYIVGVWENTVEYGLEYKWLELTHLL